MTNRLRIGNCDQRVNVVGPCFTLGSRCSLLTIAPLNENWNGAVKSFGLSESWILTWSLFVTTASSNSLWIKVSNTFISELIQGYLPTKRTINSRSPADCFAPVLVFTLAYINYYLQTSRACRTYVGLTEHRNTKVCNVISDAKGDLGNPCRDDGQCNDVNANCVQGVCACSKDYFARNSTCGNYRVFNTCCGVVNILRNYFTISTENSDFRLQDFAF